MNRLAMGAALAELRKRAGYSQAELHAKTGIARETISRMESGERQANLKHLQALAKLYGRTVDSMIEELGSASQSAADFEERKVIAFIQAAKDFQNWTDAEAAIRLGLEVPLLKGLLSGQVTPTKEHLETMANFLGVPSSYIVEAATVHLKESGVSGNSGQHGLLFLACLGKSEATTRDVFSERLNFARLNLAHPALGWNELAEDSGVSYKTCIDYYRSEKPVTVEHLKTFSAFFNRPMEWFLIPGDPWKEDPESEFSELDSGLNPTTATLPDPILAHLRAAEACAEARHQQQMEAHQQMIGAFAQLLTKLDNLGNDLQQKKIAKLEAELKATRHRRRQQQLLDSPAAPGLAGEG